MCKIILCRMCKHYGVNYTCSAFPKGIPKQVMNGNYNHVVNIEGDLGFKFEFNPSISEKMKNSCLKIASDNTKILKDIKTIDKSIHKRTKSKHLQSWSE